MNSVTSEQERVAQAVKTIPLRGLETSRRVGRRVSERDSGRQSADASLMHTQAASVPGLRPVFVSVFTRPAHSSGAV